MVSRRAFLKAIAATAIAVPLAPLVPKYATGGTITPPLEWSLGWEPSMLPALEVRKLSAWIPISLETLEDGVMVWAPPGFGAGLS